MVDYNADVPFSLSVHRRIIIGGVACWLTRFYLQITT